MSGQEEGRRAERGNSGLTMAQSVTPAKWSDTFLLKRVRASRMSPSWKGRGTRISLVSRVVDAAEEACTHPRSNDLLHRQQPRPPFGLWHSHPSQILDLDSMQRVVRWQPDGDLHRLLIDDVARRHLVRGGQDFDGEVLVLELSHGVGLTESRQLVVDDDGGEVARGEGGDGHRELPVLAFEPPGADEGLERGKKVRREGGKEKGKRDERERG